MLASAVRLQLPAQSPWPSPRTSALNCPSALRHTPLNRDPAVTLILKPTANPTVQQLAPVGMPRRQTRASPLRAVQQDGNGAAQDTSRVVILGGGIIGASIAYFLTQRGVKPIIIERIAVAAAASGKAGGFLARSWGNGGPTQQLHELSFDLHEQLSRKLGISSYRRIPTLSVAGGKPRRGAPTPPASWLDGDVAKAQMMDEGTAQVTPFEATSRLMEAAVAAGAELRIGTVVGVDTIKDKAGTRRVTAVRLAAPGSAAAAGAEREEVLVEATQVVVAMGPWSVLAEDWFNDASTSDGLKLRVPLEGVKSTSLVYSSEAVRSRVTAEPFALFCAEDSNGCHMEVYPRSNGEVYICGCGGSDYVSGPRLRAGGDCEHQGLVQADPRRVKAAGTSFAGLTSLGRDAAGKPSGPDISQACMRPCATDALPILGAVPGVEDAFLACGHNCWGILWGPVSGLAMSELLVDGRSETVDLRAFSPARFMTTQGARGRHAGQVAVGEQW